MLLVGQLLGSISQRILRGFIVLTGILTHG